MPRCLTLLCTYRQTGIQIVCRETEAICRQEDYIPDDDDEFTSVVKHLTKHLVEEPLDRKIESIMDHVDGYPKIYNFSLVMK